MMGDGWIELALTFALFIASHSVPARPAVKRKLVHWLGERGYLLVYSVTSICILAVLIIAAGRAPHLELWTHELSQRWIPVIAMPIVCILIAFSVGAPNPLSFGGRFPELFDPGQPGIAGVTRHPLLWALALWAMSHVVPNGDLAHVLLFGGFAAFALIGMNLIDHRLKRRLGQTEWHRLAERTSIIPFMAWFDGRWRPGLAMPSRESYLRLGSGLVLYAGLFALHDPVIGVSVMGPFV